MDEPDKGNFDPLSESPTEPAPSRSEPGEEDDYAQASRRAGSYLNTGQVEPKEPLDEPEKGGHKNLIVSFIALICLALLAGGIYWFSLRKSPTVAANQPPASKAAAPASLIDTKTKSYDSPNFNLSFNYPADWTVSDEGGGVMTVKSPTLKLKNADGQSVNGTVVLSIRQRGEQLPEFNKGNATAVRDSVKISYTHPTQTQRADTYISFAQYASTTTLGALDSVYITADLGYQKGQAIPQTDVGQVDPLISLSFLDAAGKPMSVSASMWDDANFSGPLTKMLESFAIQ